MGATVSTEAFDELQKAYKTLELEPDRMLNALRAVGAVFSDSETKVQEELLDGLKESVETLAGCLRSSIAAIQVGAANVISALDGQCLLLDEADADEESKAAVLHLLALFGATRCIPSLVLMTMSTEAWVKEAGASALATLALNVENRRMVASDGGLKPLVIMALSLEESVQISSCRALARLSLECEELCTAHSSFSIGEEQYLASEDGSEYLVCRVCTATCWRGRSYKYRRVDVFTCQCSESGLCMSQPVGNRAAIAASGGLSALLRLLLRPSATASVVDQVAYTLALLAGERTNRSKLATVLIDGRTGLSVLLLLLAKTKSDVVVEHLTRCLSCIAQDESTVEAFRVPVEGTSDGGGRLETGISIIVRRAESTAQSSTRMNAALTLLHLSIDSRNQQQIVAADGLAPLVSLASEVDLPLPIQRRAAWSLVNVAALAASGHDVGSTTSTARFILQPLLVIAARTPHDPIVRREATRALSFLALRDDCQSQLVDMDGVTVLLTIAQASFGVRQDSQTLVEAVKALSNLTMCVHRRDELVSNVELVEFFELLLSETASTVAVEAKLALGNLRQPSLFASTATDDDKARIAEFVRLALSKDSYQSGKAAGALSNLAASSVNHLLLVDELDAVTPLIVLARSSIGSVSTQREAARALSVLTSRPDGLLVWLKFDNAARLAADSTGTLMPVMVGSPTSAAHRTAEGSAASRSRVVAWDAGESSASVSRTRMFGSAGSGLLDGGFGAPRPAESSVWGAEFGAGDVMLLKKGGVQLPKENEQSWTISVWFRLPLPPTDSGFHALCQSTGGDTVVGVHPFHADVEEEMGCFDAEEKKWYGSGFSLKDRGPGLYHLVVMGVKDDTWFYMNGRYRGKITGYRCRSDVFAVGNSARLGQQWGGIADFRLYPRKIKNDILRDPKSLFNQPMWDAHQMRLAKTGLPVDYVLFRVAELGAIPVLIALLSSPHPAVTIMAARALANLALFPGNRVRVIEEGGLRPLVLHSNSRLPELRYEAGRALLNLA